MKRSAPLRRVTPLRSVGGTTRRTGNLRPRREALPPDWHEARLKVRREGECRVCEARPDDPGVKAIEAAHVIPGRLHDHRDETGRRVVLAVDVVPLCTRWDRKGCHTLYDEHAIDLAPYLTAEERCRADDVAGPGRAVRIISGRAAA